MALTRSKLADIQTIAATAASVYANPASTKTVIRGFVIYNSNTTAETVQLYNVPDSSSALGTAGDSTNTFMKFSIVAGETLLIELPYVITLTDTNDAIFAKTTTASKVTLQILGDKE